MADFSYHLISLLSSMSQRKGKEVALRGFDSHSNWKEVSWERLNFVTDQLAKSLIERGVAAQDKCAVLSQNCPQWTCADIGVLKARNVLVPIYPTSTLEQAEFILKDAAVKVLFVNSDSQYQMACELKSRLNSIQYIVVFDGDVQLLDDDSHVHFDDIVAEKAFDTLYELEFNHRLETRSLDDLVTLIYTSGTTGDPKGVMLDYRNFASIIEQHEELLDFEDGDTSLAFLPLSHVYERSWTFYVLAQGGVNVYLSDTTKVKDAISEYQPQTVCVVPRFLEKVYSAIQDKVSKGSRVQQSIFAWAMKVGNKQFLISQSKAKSNPWHSVKNAIASKLVFSKFQNALGGQLKFMPCGGAALDAEVAGFFHAINVPILCGYGMTETTATVTCNTINNRVTGSNGKPLAGIEIKFGQDNEILIKGETVMRGYYNRPEDTQASFEDGWFKTGDAGEFDEQGNLFITDRIKELMKTSNGKYIAPQRVEGKVGTSPFIEQVAIIADAKNYVTALIVPAFENLEVWAKEQGIKAENTIELLKHNRVVEHFEQRLKDVQKDLAGFEKIKRFTLLPKEFSMEEGLITPTLKLRRKKIYEAYKKEITSMYQAKKEKSKAD